MNRLWVRALGAQGIGVLALVAACGHDDSLGDNQGAKVTEEATGGSASPTGGTRNQGGSKSAPTGGVSNPTGGSVSEPGGAGGALGEETGGTKSLPTGGTSPGTGGSPPVGTGGASEPAGGAPDGAGGAVLGTGGVDSGGFDLDDVVSDPNATGTTLCEDVTLGEVIAQVHAEHPNLADITMLYRPDLIGGGLLIFAVRHEYGFRLAFDRGSGDCPAGCINHEVVYFQTNSACEPVLVGHYARRGGAGGCLEIVGEKLWELPPGGDPEPTCPAPDASLNSTCPDNDECPAGLEPVTFYGVAGPQGPEFCWCSIRCADDPNVCPNATRCTTLADGPSDICYPL
jgi:hypothetical protein